MLLVSLCSRRSLALQISAAADQAGLSWRTVKPDTAAFQQRICAEQPNFAVITSDYLSDPLLFTDVRTGSPETLIIVCLTPETASSQELWARLDQLEFDVLCSSTELLECLLSLKTGRFYQSPLLTVETAHQTKEPFAGWYDLTPAERRIMKGIVQNRTGRQIADELFISEKTVNNHKAKLSQKLGITGGPGSLTRFTLLNRARILASL